MAIKGDDDQGTRQERRERRRRKRTEMRKHGANLGTVYGNAVLKRVARFNKAPTARKRR